MREIPVVSKIEKDYDPISGRKVINKYEIIRELGRGVHGKVKLGRDLEVGEPVVSLPAVPWTRQLMYRL